MTSFWTGERVRLDANPTAGRFSYGIAIGHRHQRSGYASEAIVILLSFMFGERRYHKCEVGIYASNEASIALHHKLGFVDEGRLRDHEYFAGRHHDKALLGSAHGRPKSVSPCGPRINPPAQRWAISC